MNAQVEGKDVEEAFKKKPGPKPKTDEEKAAIKEQKKVEKVVSTQERIAKMNNHIQRQWDGQSPNLGVAERSARIKLSIKKHGWMDVVDHLKIDETRQKSFVNPGHRKVSEYL